MTQLRIRANGIWVNPCTTDVQVWRNGAWHLVKSTDKFYYNGEWVNLCDGLAWRGFDGACNETGYFVYAQLEQYIISTGIATGTYKPNVDTDPDYIAPIFDTEECPISGTTVILGKTGISESGICGHVEQTFYLDGSGVVAPYFGYVLYTSADFSTPYLGITHIVISGIVYNVDPDTAAIGSPTGGTCGV